VVGDFRLLLVVGDFRLLLVTNGLLPMFVMWAFSPFVGWRKARIHVGLDTGPLLLDPALVQLQANGRKITQVVQMRMCVMEVSVVNPRYV
jgi:hypothetical protein